MCQGGGRRVFAGSSFDFPRTSSGQVSVSPAFAGEALNVRLDTYSRLYVFDQDLAVEGGSLKRPGDPPRVCWDGINGQPWNVAGTAPVLTPVSIGQFPNLCIGRGTFRYTVTLPMSTTPIYGDFLNCPFRDEIDRTSLASILQSCQCIITNMPLATSCITPNVDNSLVSPYTNAQRDPYSEDISFEIGSPRTGRYFYPGAEQRPNGVLSEITPPADLHWAQVPYPAADFAGPVSVRLDYQTIDGLQKSWRHGIRSMRNYDIGTCDVTFNWSALSDMVVDRALREFRLQLSGGFIPELLSPPNRLSCSYRQAADYLQVTGRSGPIFGRSPAEDGELAPGPNLGFSLRYDYSHPQLADGHRMVHRGGRVFIRPTVNVQRDDANGVPGGRPIVVQTINAQIEGDSHSPDASANGYAPLGWQMARLLAGQRISAQREGGTAYDFTCATDAGPAPTSFQQILSDELDRRMMVYFRFPYAPTTSPNDAASCVDRFDSSGTAVPGLQPQYVFCETGTNVAPFARAPGLSRATAGNCAARLQQVLDETAGPRSPMAQSLANWGVSSTELFRLPGAGCYALSDLPDWVQNEPTVAQRIADNTSLLPGDRSGICAVRIQTQRMNLLPDGLQFVVLDDESISVASSTMEPGDLNPPASYRDTGLNFIASLQQFRFLSALEARVAPSVPGTLDGLPINVSCNRGIYRSPSGDSTRIAMYPDGRPRVGAISPVLQGHAQRECRGTSCVTQVPTLPPYVGQGPTRCAYSW